jgi:phenylacetate-CoA ligase
MFADIRRLEFIRDDGSSADVGEIGDVLVTDLENRIFPLVRYRIGDRGTLRRGTCPCGVTLPLMEKVRGRVSDCLRLPAGRIMAGEYVTTIFDGSPLAVTNFQVFQHGDGHVTLKCVLGSTPNALSIVQTTARLLQKKVGTATPVQLEIVESIPHDRGKMRFVISEHPG